MADFLKDKEGNRLDVFSDDYDTVNRSEWIPITIPTNDVMGDEFPVIRINAHEFKPGVEHMVPPAYAEHIETIIARHQKESLRRLRPNADIEALRQQAGFGTQRGVASYLPETK